MLDVYYSYTETVKSKLVEKFTYLRFDVSNSQLVPESNSTLWSKMLFLSTAIYQPPKTREREKKFAVVLDAANDVINFQ